MTGLRAVIVGAGIGGVAAAAALARNGIDVRVYEQAPQLGEVGAGVVLAPNSLRLLQRLGLGAEISRCGARLADTQLCRADGRPAAHDPGQFSRPGERYGMHRADLLAMLASQLPGGVVRPGYRCTGFDQHGEHATVSFANGQRVDADVVIGADGIHSALQGHVVEPSEPVFSGMVAYRGVIPAERVTSWPAGTLRVWMGDGKHFLVYPVRAGQLLNYAGFVPSGGVPRALLAYETLRRDRTARIQQDARLNGAIYDNSGNTPGSRPSEPGVRLPNRRWIYDYDIQAEAAPVAAALTNG